MEKTYYWLTWAMFALLVACTPPTNPVQISVPITSVSKVGLASQSVVMKIKVRNTSNQDATIHWERTALQTILGWAYTVDGATASTGTVNIPANSSVEVELGINPNGQAGEGQGILEFYDPLDRQMTSKTVQYTLTALTDYFRLNLASDAHQTGYSSMEPDYNHQVWVVNDNSIPVRVEWARTQEARNPAVWGVAAKTHLICYAVPVIRDYVDVPPMDSIPFKICFYHNGVAGTASSRSVFWVATDSLPSVRSQLFTYTVLP